LRGAAAPAPFVFAPALRVVAFQQQRERQVHVRVGKIRLDRDGAPTRGNRFLDLALLSQRVAEI
jgi:hypothetical protein